ncbi:MAG: hypothetical protein KAH20_09855 [Methylococcales bacterium]|nr:hypothetical protein [Methylococcales bacterium]
MFHSLTKIISAVTILLVTSSPHAAIMTFNSALVSNGDDFYPYYQEDGTHYQEDGITSSANYHNFHIQGGTKALHLDDVSGPGIPSANFHMDSLFSAVSFDIPFRSNSRNTSYITDYVKAEGFLNGNLVASTIFPEAGSSTLLLPATFTGLDNLTLSVVSYWDHYINNSTVSDNPTSDDPAICYLDPCNHFNIDNIVLEPVVATPPSIAPVPLPTAFPLMASGFACLSLFRRKKIDLKGQTLIQLPIE